MAFGNLPANHYGAILADPPWRYRTWDKREELQKTGLKKWGVAGAHYRTMDIDEIRVLPVNDLAAPDCALFLWVTWPNLLDALTVIEAWGFTYKTCAFAWTKAHANQIEMFQDEIDPYVGLGYWTRANTEPCLLATRGHPVRLNKDVRQAIIEPRREHSRKPKGVHARIQRLVAGPYLELFARARHPDWDAWGNEVDKFQGETAPSEEAAE